MTIMTETTRRTNPDALALGAALRSSLGPLRKTAREILAAVLREHAGNLYATAKALGIDRKAIERMVAGDAQLSRTRIAAARGRKPGRGRGQLPAALREGAS